ncbi:MAG: hypothetical protein GPOALKHO_001285 [Sodalis sp.]|nr:MAG: hypothetical protein GPOALKHO_001285 [Sodalis sp.]
MSWLRLEIIDWDSVTMLRALHPFLAQRIAYIGGGLIPIRRINTRVIRLSSHTTGNINFCGGTSNRLI